jgi:hypothetical protein
MDDKAYFVEQFVEEHNIILTTEFLLTIDSHALTGRNRLQSYYLLNGFQKAYNVYYRIRQKDCFVLFTLQSRELLFQYTLSQLQDCARRLIPNLKEPALNYLKSYINDPTIGLPVYEIWE